MAKWTHEKENHEDNERGVFFVLKEGERKVGMVDREADAKKIVKALNGKK